MNELMTLNDSQSLSDVIQSGSEQDLQKLLGSEPTGPQSSLSRLSITLKMKMIILYPGDFIRSMIRVVEISFFQKV